MSVDNRPPNFLYHYTTLETLALILKNRTIRLMPLSRMDDKQESKASDLEQMGQFSFASCWTAEEKESIPMWKMYAGLPCGVRIGLPVNPFVNYSYTAVELFQLDKGSSIISGNPESLKYSAILPPMYVRMGAFTPSFFGETDYLIKVIYTDEASLLEPKLMSLQEGKTHIAINKLGRYKNTYWEFQKEYRYVMEVYPSIMGRVPDPQSRLDAFTRFTSKLATDQLRSQFNYVDVDIRPDALDKLEIMLSPGMSQGNKLLAKSLLDKYGYSNHTCTSVLEGLI